MNAANDHTDTQLKNSVIQLTMTHPAGSLHITTLHGSFIVLGVWPLLTPSPYFAHWMMMVLTNVAGARTESGRSLHRRLREPSFTPLGRAPVQTAPTSLATAALQAAATFTRHRTRCSLVLPAGSPTNLTSVGLALRTDTDISGPVRDHGNLNVN